MLHYFIKNLMHALSAFAFLLSHWQRTLSMLESRLGPAEFRIVSHMNWMISSRDSFPDRPSSSGTDWPPPWLTMGLMSVAHCLAVPTGFLQNIGRPTDVSNFFWLADRFFRFAYFSPCLCPCASLPKYASLWLSVPVSIWMTRCPSVLFFFGYRKPS